LSIIIATKSCFLILDIFHQINQFQDKKISLSICNKASKVMIFLMILNFFFRSFHLDWKCSIWSSFWPWWNLVWLRSLLIWTNHLWKTFIHQLKTSSLVTRSTTSLKLGFVPRGNQYAFHQITPSLTYPTRMSKRWQVFFHTDFKVLN